MKPEHIVAELQHVKDEYLLELNAPTRRRRAPRWGIIAAACLCAALISSAFAVSGIVRLVSDLSPSEHGPHYEVTGTVGKFPLSMFSDELIEASETRGTLAVVQRQFATWPEVKNFIGTDISYIWPNHESWSGIYTVHLFHTGFNKLWGVTVESFDPNTQTKIEIEIYTEHYPPDPVTISNTTYSDTDTVIPLDPISMPGGQSAETVMILGPETHPDARCNAVFVQEGAAYTVTVFGTVEKQEEMLPRLTAILDCFT